MLLGPIVTLEMITGARRLRYFIIRVVYAVLLLLMLWSNYEGATMRHRYSVGQGAVPSGLTIQEVAQFSQRVFYSFSFVQLIAVLLLTPAMFAGAIAQERERKTIEYMFASMLTNTEIVMSKFLARTFHVVSLLAVGLPVLALAMMLGGVDPTQLMTVFAMTVAVLFSTASLSIAVSVHAKRSRDAVVRAYLFLILLLLFVPLLFLLLAVLADYRVEIATKIMPTAEYLLRTNPFTALTLVLTNGFGGHFLISPWQIATPLLVSHFAFGAALLAYSSYAIRRVYRKSVSTADRPSRRGKFRLFRRPALGDRPILWKEMFAPSETSRLGWAGRIVILLLLGGSLVPGILALYFYDPSYHMQNNFLEREIGAMGMVICTGLEIGALLVIMVRAASAITSEKERDTWISLISTPLDASEIVLGKMAGAIYSARWFLLPIVGWLLMVAVVAPRYLFIVPVLSLIFACIVLAIAATGLWFSQWCRTSIRAMASAIGVAVFAGGGYLMCCMPIMIGTRVGDDGIFVCAGCIPFLLAMPGFLWGASFESHHASSEEVRFAITCMLGTVAYFVVSLLMTGLNVNSFDDFAARPRNGMLVPHALLSKGPIPPGDSTTPLPPADGLTPDTSTES